MRTLLTITDLTRMAGDHVCLAGYTPEMQCIRPTQYTGITEGWLYQAGAVAIRPFTTIDCDLIPIPTHPPHVEDRNVGLRYRVVRHLAEPEQQRLLEGSLFPDITAIYEAPILHDYGFYLLDGTGQRSLGTIRPQTIDQVIYAARGDRWDYRLYFSDGAGTSYRLTITDLAWRYYCDHQYLHAHLDPATIVQQLQETLQSRTVYLRIGTARGWKEHPDRCFIQITGVYTFPDWLAGKCFADYAPQAMPRT